MIKLIVSSCLSLVVLTGCEYVGPSKPTKPYGTSKYKYERLNKEVKTPGFLKNFLGEDNAVAAKGDNTGAVEATATTLPNFKGDYLKMLKEKYPMLDVSKIEDKDLMRMLELYSQELNKIKARLQ